MKKSLLLMFMCLFLVTGCGKKDKVMICTLNNEVGDIKLVSTYEVYYNDKFVNRIKTEEKMISNNSSLISKYKETVESKYSLYKNVKYYNYSVKIEGNTLISTTDINYSKIDTDKLLKIDSANKELINDGKILVSDVKDVYNQLGVKCKK